MSTKSPAFQFYAAEYLSDLNVQIMTLEEEGAYIRLLAYCWREGSIPNNDEMLSRLCKGASTTLITVVKRCFEPSEDGATLRHKRLDAERQKQEAWREKSAEGGRLSAEKRKKLRRKAAIDRDLSLVKGGSTMAARVAEECLVPNGNSSSSSSSSKKEEPPNPLKGEPSDRGLSFADWFRTLIPASVRLEGNWRANWAKVYDDLIRLDHRTDRQIVDVCQWARSDDFWSKAFLSPLKLRQKDKSKTLFYDIFAARMKPGKNSAAPTDYSGGF